MSGAEQETTQVPVQPASPRPVEPPALWTGLAVLIVAAAVAGWVAWDSSRREAGRLQEELAVREAELVELRAEVAGLRGRLSASEARLQQAVEEAERRGQAAVDQVRAEASLLLEATRSAALGAFGEAWGFLEQAKAPPTHPVWAAVGQRWADEAVADALAAVAAGSPILADDTLTTVAQAVASYQQLRSLWPEGLGSAGEGLDLEPVLQGAGDPEGAPGRAPAGAAVPPAAASLAEARRAVVRALTLEGLRAWEQRNPLAAVELLGRALERGGLRFYNDDLLYAYGKSLEALGRPAQAEEAFTRLTREYPRTEHADDGWFELGLLYAGTGRPEEAVEAFRTVVERYPDAVWYQDDALYHLSQLYRQLGQLDAAALTARRLRESFPESPWTR